MRRPTRVFLQNWTDLDLLVEKAHVSQDRKTGNPPVRRLQDTSSMSSRPSQLTDAKISRDPDLISTSIEKTLTGNHFSYTDYKKFIDLAWLLVDHGYVLNKEALIDLSESLSGYQKSTNDLAFLRNQYLDDLTWNQIGRLMLHLSNHREKSLDETVMFSFCMGKLREVISKVPDEKEFQGLAKSIRALENYQTAECFPPATSTESHHLTLTIGMPAYNSSETISKAIESILSQTFREIELLIVDDYSSDNTVEIAKAYADGDSRVKVMRNDQNFGAYYSRNIALANAQGDLFTIHDSDDWSFPQKYERQVQDILERDLVANYSHHSRYGEGGIMRLAFTKARYVNPNLSSLMFRRKEVVEEIGYWFQGRVGMDSEYFERIKLAFPNKVFSLARIDTLVRFSQGSLTGNTITSPSSKTGRLYRLANRMVWEQWISEKSISKYAPENGSPRPIMRIPSNQEPHENNVVINQLDKIDKTLVSKHLSGEATLAIIV